MDFGALIVLIIVCFVCCLTSASAGYWGGVQARHIDKRESLKEQLEQVSVTQARLQATQKP